MKEWNRDGFHCMGFRAAICLQVLKLSSLSNKASFRGEQTERTEQIVTDQYLTLLLPFQPDQPSSSEEGVC
jgi:hypothetical protein